jgi:membrane associated rhomboid family serine protease
VFNFGNPKTPGQWIGHIAGAIIGLFLIWWLLRVYVL